MVLQPRSSIPWEDIASQSYFKRLTGEVVCESRIRATGGFGNVRRGTWYMPNDDLIMGKPSLRPVLVAVKELHGKQQQESWERIYGKFCREMGIWRPLDHTNVIPFYGYTMNEEGAVALVSPWCEHGNLREYLHDHPDASRENLVLDVAEGIAYLHSLVPPIVHGDLKAVNVLVNRYHIACICDFGTASFVGEAALHSGFTTTSDLKAGSLAWMAPELYGTECVRKTFESDMFAFGGVVLEILSGKGPFYYCASTALTEIVLGRHPKREEYQFLDEHAQYWDLIVDRLWNNTPSHRIKADELVKYLYAAFRLHPRRALDQRERARAFINNGNDHRLGVLRTDLLAGPMSVSPDGAVCCAVSQNGDTGSTDGIYFYDLRQSQLPLLWSIPLPIARGDGN